MDEMYQDLLSELECPVCLAHMTPPILQCVNGHSICSGCRTQLQECPICKQSFTSTRNISLEKMSAKIPFSCCNKKYGCDVKIPLSRKQEHENECKNKGVACQLLDCTWRGKGEELLDHWSSKTNVKLYITSFLCQAKLNDNKNFANLIIHNNTMFWLKSKKANDNVYFAVQVINKDATPNHFSFEIEVFKRDMQKRKMVFIEYCSGLKEGFGDDVFASPHAISLSKFNLERFLDENGMFLYRIRVLNALDNAQCNHNRRARGHNNRRMGRARFNRSRDNQSQNEDALLNLQSNVLSGQLSRFTIGPSTSRQSENEPVLFDVEIRKEICEQIANVLITEVFNEVQLQLSNADRENINRIFVDMLLPALQNEVCSPTAIVLERAIPESLYSRLLDILCLENQNEMVQQLSSILERNTRDQTYQELLNTIKKEVLEEIHRQLSNVGLVTQ